jgi:predicted AAA+ superfamily ATPase
MPYTLEESLIYGTLPRMVLLPKNERADFLRSYAEIYLEEEIRAEAISRKIGAFSRFLELAAAESGASPNFTKLSNESGVSLPAIKEFYQALEDTLIVERLDPFLRNARKRIFSRSKYYFFDLGVRNVLARFPLDKNAVHLQQGMLFEHAVILEILRRVRVLNKNYKVCYWRTSGGAEVDCVVDMGDRVLPIEIKSGSRVEKSEMIGLKNFLQDYADMAESGIIVFRGARKEQLAPNITAIPWQEF